MPGIVVEKGITDANNMGAAMAPAAANTLRRYFEATGDKPGDYDCILTGDLGYEGGSILCDLLLIDGIDIRGVYADCGQIIYDREAQDMHAGGSGCGCSAVVLASYFLPRIKRGDLRRILFLGTGAMMSPDSIKQGGAIPGIAHLLRLETGGKNVGEVILPYVWAFLIGGGFCVIAQILIDKTRLTPARILVIYVCAGVLLGAVGVYKPLAEFAGCGATTPLTGFGYLISKGVREAVEEKGLIGALTGGLSAAAGRNCRRPSVSDTLRRCSAGEAEGVKWTKSVTVSVSVLTFCFPGAMLLRGNPKWDYGGAYGYGKLCTDRGTGPGNRGAAQPGEPYHHPLPGAVFRMVGRSRNRVQ